jgi:hypothetical protein|tara:strand:+ start:2041 stop:2433 length:393 start_codon:yes stop_codon:yes gene_type:complete
MKKPATYLGNPCKRKHFYKDTRKTLRLKTSKYCIECQRDWTSTYYKENKTKLIKRSSDWRKNNRKKYIESVRKLEASQRKNLEDTYIKKLLMKNLNLKYNEITSEMITSHRSYIEIMRKHKEVKLLSKNI